MTIIAQKRMYANNWAGAKFCSKAFDMKKYMRRKASRTGTCSDLLSEVACTTCDCFR